MKLTLPKKLIAPLLKDNSVDSTGYALERGPIHTVYGGADKYSADLPRRFSKLSLAVLEQYASTAPELVRATEIRCAAEHGNVAYKRMLAKLSAEPIEDFRADFEDGFGSRSNKEEDAVACGVAQEFAKALSMGSAPKRFGIRIKALSGSDAARALRTLELFVATLRNCLKLKYPSELFITIPKVRQALEVKVLDESLLQLEKTYGIKAGTHRIEMLCETPQAYFAKDGSFVLPKLILTAQDRLSSIQFGAFDFTSELGVGFLNQSNQHDFCQYARFLMKMAAAQFGMPVVDSITNILPIPPNKAGNLTRQQKRENKSAVWRGWSEHGKNIQNALNMGILRGWDLHPAQLPIRFFVTYHYFLSGLEKATTRILKFSEALERVSRSGGTFDDLATVRGLLNFLASGYECGAFTREQVEQCGLSLSRVLTRQI